MSRLLSDLDPDVRTKAIALLAAAHAKDIALAITQTYRTFAEQTAIYAQGRTAPGRIVTHARAGYSWHNWRRAFDVDILSFPGDTTPHDLYDGPWSQVGALGESLGLAWGGRWKQPDIPHFELTCGLTLAGLLAQHPNGLPAPAAVA